MGRILVTGSRDWQDEGSIVRGLKQAIVRLHHYDGITLVVGACPMGVDEMAERLWREHLSRDASLVPPWGLGIERHPAEWQRYGKAAGYRRNKEMVNLGADLCLAFIKDGSKGATYTAKKAVEAGIETWIWYAHKDVDGLVEVRSGQ